MSDSDKEHLLQNLPSIIDDSAITLPDHIPLQENSTLKEAKTEDLKMANFQMDVLYAAWGQVKSIAGVSRLVDATIKATKHRRDVLGLEYGHQSQKQGKDGLVWPLD